MKVYNGGSISNVIINLNKSDIYVTDCVARAIRYANAQATEEVNSDMNQSQEQNTIILEIEVENEPKWLRRTNGNSLDSCEAHIKTFEIKKATIRFKEYKNTLYGTRWTGYKTESQVIELLSNSGIEVEVK